MTGSRSFERLLEEALGHPVEGWDFGWLEASGRFEEDGPPWDYRSLVAERAKDSPDLLDLGTGGAGGEGASVTATIPVKPGGSITVVAGCAGRGTGRRRREVRSRPNHRRNGRAAG